jgi:hypothetical protein
MGGTCNTHEGNEICKKKLFKSLKGTGIDGRIILKWVSNKQMVRMWTFIM